METLTKYGVSNFHPFLPLPAVTMAESNKLHYLKSVLPSLGTGWGCTTETTTRENNATRHWWKIFHLFSQISNVWRRMYDIMYDIIIDKQDILTTKHYQVQQQPIIQNVLKHL